MCIRDRLQVAHIKLSHSRAFLLRAYLLQTHEMLFDAHWHGFRVFGGVPDRGIYDNMKTAVDRVGRGKERQGNMRFLAMANHHVFEPEFCNPAPGWGVRSLPSHSRVVLWAGVNYRFFDGVWYSPAPHGYAVVRPPYGIVVADLPAFRTLLVIGGIAYLYANGVYYRERGEGGYEVVPPPVAADAPAAGSEALRMFVYPRAGQSADQQATDEYECHRWAVTQTGFDPTAVATATSGADLGRRDHYQRARSACLEGRNYTVR